MTRATAIQITDAPDISVIRSKAKATWEDGDYAAFAKYMEAGAVEILTSWNIAPGQRLLDVGCGLRRRHQSDRRHVRAATRTRSG